MERKSVVAFFATTAADEKTYKVEYFNLDAILSVGCRVNSKRGTQFRIWATRVLRDHFLRGYAVNERRLKELNQAIRLIADVAERRALPGCPGVRRKAIFPRVRAFAVCAFFAQGADDGKKEIMGERRNPENL